MSFMLAIIDFPEALLTNLISSTYDHGNGRTSDLGFQGQEEEKEGGAILQ
jgi:hypothetical protein